MREPSPERSLVIAISRCSVEMYSSLSRSASSRARVNSVLKRPEARGCPPPNCFGRIRCLQGGAENIHRVVSKFHQWSRFNFRMSASAIRESLT